MTKSERITRRTFLRRTAWGAALLAVGGTLAKNATGYRLDEAIARRLTVLSPKEAIVFRAAAARLVGDGEGGAPSVDEVDVIGAADRYLLQLPAYIVSDVRSLLQLFEHSPILFDLTPSRFTRLDGAGQDAVLAGWARSRLDVRRQGFNALKSLAMLAYYGDPRTFAIPGYPGPMLPT